MTASGNYSTSPGRASELASAVHALFTEKHLTLAAAESITGGLISSSVISVPGASQFFKGGVVAYSNESKEKILGVRRRTLVSHGAVSRETAIEMAYGAGRIFQSTVSVSSTGIAGPSGQTDSKPLGLVFMAVASEDSSSVEEKRYEGGREEIRHRATADALTLLLKFME